MYYIVPAAKSVDEAASDLEAAVLKHQFGILNVLDLKQTLTNKGYPFGPQCKIFEVCNPLQATRALQRDMRLNMALPCRISVFSEHGQTRIGMLRPTQMLAPLSQDPALSQVAREVEQATIRMIDDEPVLAVVHHDERQERERPGLLRIDPYAVASRLYTDHELRLEENDGPKLQNARWSGVERTRRHPQRKHVRRVVGDRR